MRRPTELTKLMELLKRQIISLFGYEYKSACIKVERYHDSIIVSAGVPGVDDVAVSSIVGYQSQVSIILPIDFNALKCINADSVRRVNICSEYGLDTGTTTDEILFCLKSALDICKTRPCLCVSVSCFPYRLWQTDSANNVIITDGTVTISSGGVNSMPDNVARIVFDYYNSIGIHTLEYVMMRDVADCKRILLCCKIKHLKLIDGGLVRNSINVVIDSDFISAAMSAGVKTLSVDIKRMNALHAASICELVARCRMGCLTISAIDGEPIEIYKQIIRFVAKTSCVKILKINDSVCAEIAREVLQCYDLNEFRSYVTSVCSCDPAQMLDCIKYAEANRSLLRCEISLCTHQHAIYDMLTYNNYLRDCEVQFNVRVLDIVIAIWNTIPSPYIIVDIMNCMSAEIRDLSLKKKVARCLNVFESIRRIKGE